MGGHYSLERKAIFGNIIKIITAYLVTMNICNQFVQKSFLVALYLALIQFLYMWKCLFLELVALYLALQFELVALNLALQFAYLGKYQVCELGKRNMCNQFVHKNFCLENWLHLIWPYSSRSCESIRYGNWCLLICETSSFIMTFLSSELVPTYLCLIFNFLAFHISLPAIAGL